MFIGFKSCWILWADSPPRAEGLREATEPDGLIFGLIRLRSSVFIGVRMDVLEQIADVNGIRRTVIPSPENRKVGGSTLPWPPSTQGQLPIYWKRISLTTHHTLAHTALQPAPLHGELDLRYALESVDRQLRRRSLAVFV